MEDRDRVILHLIKRLETECDSEECLDIIQEIKRILSIWNGDGGY